VNRFRPALTAAIAAVAVALAAAPAGAALFVVLEPASGAPGTGIIGRTGGQGALGDSPDARIPLFLVAEGVVGDLPGKVDGADALTTDGRLLPIGDLVGDPDGNGLLEFAVPELPPARYEVFAYCPSCEPYSFGRNLVPVGEFQVTDPAGRYSTRFSPWPLLTAAAFVALIALAALVGRRGRRDQDRLAL